MRCPMCQNVNSHKKVLRTWLGKNAELKRKRRCSQCKGFFYTVERAVRFEKIIPE